jgi:hypothetical protein
MQGGAQCHEVIATIEPTSTSRLPQVQCSAPQTRAQDRIAPAASRIRSGNESIKESKSDNDGSPRTFSHSAEIGLYNTACSNYEGLVVHPSASTTQAPRALRAFSPDPLHRPSSDVRTSHARFLATAAVSRLSRSTPPCCNCTAPCRSRNRLHLLPHLTSFAPDRSPRLPALTTTAEPGSLPRTRSRTRAETPQRWCRCRCATPGRSTCGMHDTRT